MGRGGLVSFSLLLLVSTLLLTLRSVTGATDPNAVSGVIAVVSFTATFASAAGASLLADAAATASLTTALRAAVGSVGGAAAAGAVVTVAALYPGSSLVAELAVAFPATATWGASSALKAALTAAPTLPAASFAASVGAGAITAIATSSVTPGPACVASTLGYACSLAVTPSLTVHWNLTVFAASPLVDELSVALVAPAFTWLSIGFPSSSGTMAPADAVIGLVGASGGLAGSYQMSGYLTSMVRF